MTAIVIYSDLDGTLLDHHDYSHAAADGLLARLDRRGIPVVLCTSKTRAELLALRRELNNRHPFIVENGAAVCIPEGYLPEPPSGAVLEEGFCVKAFVPGRSHWLALLRQGAQGFAGKFRAFHDMTADELADLTGLSSAQAGLAAQREYGEPVQWLGSDADRERFVEALQGLGARVLRGGRFLHVSGDCDKGRAMNWLNAQLAEGGRAPVTVALGDSQNDAAMLEAADHAVLVRSPVHPFPALGRTGPTLRTSATGPAGWVEGVTRIIQTIDNTRG